MSQQQTWSPGLTHLIAQHAGYRCTRASCHCKTVRPTESPRDDLKAGVVVGIADGEQAGGIDMAVWMCEACALSSTASGPELRRWRDQHAEWLSAGAPWPLRLLRRHSFGQLIVSTLVGLAAACFVIVQGREQTNQILAAVWFAVALPVTVLLARIVMYYLAEKQREVIWASLPRLGTRVGWIAVVAGSASAVVPALLGRDVGVRGDLVETWPLVLVTASIHVLQFVVGSYMLVWLIGLFVAKKREAAMGRSPGTGVGAEIVTSPVESKFVVPLTQLFTLATLSNFAVLLSAEPTLLTPSWGLVRWSPSFLVLWTPGVLCGGVAFTALCLFHYLRASQLKAVEAGEAFSITGVSSWAVSTLLVIGGKQSVVDFLGTI